MKTLNAIASRKWKCLHSEVVFLRATHQQSVSFFFFFAKLRQSFCEPENKVWGTDDKV